MSNVKLLGDWSVSTPPLAVPPLSRTWKVKAALAAPLALAAGVKVSRPEEIFAAVMNCPAVTAEPFRRMVPVVASVLITTPAKLCEGLSFGSLKPKLAALKV